MFQGGHPSRYRIPARIFSPPPRVNIQCLPSICAISTWERGDMEIVGNEKSECCDSSDVDENQEQDRWVSGCFSPFPLKFLKWPEGNDAHYYVFQEVI